MMNNPYQTPKAELQGGKVMDADTLPSNQAIRSPWLNIWTRPRATIHDLITRQAARYPVLLIMTSGIVLGLNKLRIRSLEPELDPIYVGLILTVIFIVGPIASWILLHTMATLISWSGRWLNGTASRADLLCALVWTSIPSVLMALTKLCLFMVFGKAIFNNEGILGEGLDRLVFYFTGTFWHFAFLIWWIVLSIKGVSQAQGFSAWRGLANITIAAVLGAIIYLAIIAALTLPFT